MSKDGGSAIWPGSFSSGTPVIFNRFFWGDFCPTLLLLQSLLFFSSTFIYKNFELLMNYLLDKRKKKSIFFSLTLQLSMEEKINSFPIHTFLLTIRENKYAFWSTANFNFSLSILDESNKCR